MADKKKSVSQSRTMWVKKGDIVNGKKVSKGYLAQYGKPAKKVTAKVELTRQTGKAAAGATVRYKGGRKVIGKPAPVVRRKPTTMSAAADASTPDKPDKPKKVAVGTIRVGAAGRATNRWNGKRWVRIASEPQRKPSNTAKPAKPSGTPSNYQNLPTSKPKPAAPSMDRKTPFGPYGRVGSNVANQRLMDQISNLKKQADAAAARQRDAKASAAAKAAAAAERKRLLDEINRLTKK